MLKKTERRFGQVKLMPVKVWYKGEFLPNGDWDEEIWIERQEDWYQLNTRSEKRVRVIEREIWLRSKTVNEGENIAEE